MARKSFRFGLPVASSSQPVGGLAVSQFGSLRRPGSTRSAVYCLAACCLIQKARGGFFGAGLILATMKICRCFARRVKLFDAEIAERRERLK
jgi:hypothetical protein